MSTFVYINGRPDHMKGKHDDLIMALAMALYVGEHSFSDLTKANDLTKAMIDNWMTSSDTEDGEPNNRRPQQNIPIFGLPGNGPTDAKQLYKDNAWLFGKVR